jgi:hypothetical protein
MSCNPAAGRLLAVLLPRTDVTVTTVETIARQQQWPRGDRPSFVSLRCAVGEMRSVN